MNVEEIINTYLIQDNPKNTGLLSKSNDKKIKFGLNPLFTILNQDFNKQLRKDYEKQRKSKKQIITKEYLETNQKDIIRLYKQYYPENYEEKLKEHLVDHNNKPRKDFLHIGLDSITRSLPISLDDITAYLKRGGYNNYVFSLEARPNIIVFDFDLQVTPEEIEKIKEYLGKYIYLLEYKEDNGHLHVYLNGTEEKRLDYTNSPDHNNTLFTQENKVIPIDVFKGAKKVIGCCTRNNDYEIIYNEKPAKTIELKKAITLLGMSLGYKVNKNFLETLIPEESTPENIPQAKTQSNRKLNNNSTTRLERKTRPTTEDHKKEVIELATPLFNILVKGNRETIYRAFTGALLNHGYEDNTIEEIITEVHNGTKDEEKPRLASVRSCIKGYYRGDNLFGWTTFNNMIMERIEKQKGKNKTELTKTLTKLKRVINSHDKQIVDNPEAEKDYIILDNGLLMDVEEHKIFTFNNRTGEKYIKMTADITGVTVYEEKHINLMIHRNETRYSIKYTTITGAKGETKPEDIDVLTNLLNKETFTRDDKKTREILKNVIEYYIINGKAEYKQITPPEGFYLDIEKNNIAYLGLTEEITEYIEKEVTPEDVKTVLLEYEELSKYYKDKVKYISNTISGCQLPLTYVNKQITEEYSIQTPLIRGVSLTGTPGTGKSYNGKFILKFSGIPIENINIKLYSSINTIYRYGEQCIKSTLPLLIDEADGIAKPITGYDEELSRDIKASLTSMFVREKSNDHGKTLTSYPNYRNIIFSSNKDFNPDYGNRRRLISQVYTLTEKITPEDVTLKNEMYPDNKERITLNKFFGLFINILIHKIEYINTNEDKTTGICDIFGNKDFVKNIILDMYNIAELKTELTNMFYEYNTDTYNADITPVDTLEIIKHEIYKYILSMINEKINPDDPNNEEQKTLTDETLYNIQDLTKVLYNEIIRGNITGIATAINKRPNTMEDLEIVLTHDLVSILNTNSNDIQITLKDLEAPVNGHYTVVKKIGTRGVRLTLNELITTIFI